MCIFPSLGYADATSDREAKIRELRGKSDQDSVLQLGLMVRSLGAYQDRLDARDLDNLKSARGDLAKIPDYAERIGEIIDAQTAREIQGSYNSDYARYDYSEILEQSKTAEAVKVLGNFLFDERDPWKDIKGWGDGGRPLPNSYIALVSLSRMKIRGSPNAEDTRYPQDLKLWQTWFEEVRSGRTFSFEGDPQVYTLAGPVAQPGPTKPAFAAPSPAAGAVPSNGSSQWPLIVVLAILGVGAGVLVLRTRKALRDS